MKFARWHQPVVDGKLNEVLDVTMLDSQRATEVMVLIVCRAMFAKPSLCSVREGVEQV